MKPFPQIGHVQRPTSSISCAVNMQFLCHTRIAAPLTPTPIARATLFASRRLPNRAACPPYAAGYLAINEPSVRGANVDTDSLNMTPAKTKKRRKRLTPAPANRPAENSRPYSTTVLQYYAHMPNTQARQNRFVTPCRLHGHLSSVYKTTITPPCRM